MATFLLTIFADLTIAIGVGVTLGAFLFLHRMAEAVEVEGGRRTDRRGRCRRIRRMSARPTIRTRFNDDVIVYRISGAFFFGATAAVSSVLDRIGAHPKTFMLDFAEVPLVDSTAAKALEGFVRKLQRAGTAVYFTSAGKSVRRTLRLAGLRKPLVRYAWRIEDAVALSKGSGSK